MATYWVPDPPPILKAFLATLGIQFSYLRMVPDMRDPSSISTCYLEFVALHDVFRAEIHLHIKINELMQVFANGKQRFHSFKE